MDMTAYQHAAAKTIQPLAAGDVALAVAALGLAGEAGAVLSAYKKQLRDGPADPGYRARIREELGDVLWYLSTVAHHLGLDLGDIATANISKITDRWRHTPAEAIPFDGDLAESEQLPRHAEFVFTLTQGPDEHEMSVLTCDGVQVGDPITNASHIADGYCFHDVFHLAYAAVLGWSPVMRGLLKRKRRSDPATDEAEDGGRAKAIEEGIAALVFSYASRHQYLDGKTHIDNDVLDTVQGMVAHLEVGAHRAADWERAILTGFAVWRRLRHLGGGTVHLDMRTQTLTVAETEPSVAVEQRPSQADAFRATVERLHRSKDASYGTSWKRRGELISVMSNIARKVDRLELIAAGARPTADENSLDTAIDLYVYALKYLTYLADADPAALHALLPAQQDGPPWSDGTAGVDHLLATTDLSVIDTGPRDSATHIITTILTTFAELEACFPTAGDPAPADVRAHLATTLADEALHLVAAIRAAHPDQYEHFLQTW